MRAGTGGAGRQPLPGHLHREQVRGRGLEQGAQASGARRGRKTSISRSPPGLRPCRGDPWGALPLPSGPLPPPWPGRVASAPLIQDPPLARISQPAQGPAPSVAGLRRSVSSCGDREQPGHVGRCGSGSGRCRVPGTPARYAVGRREQGIYPLRPTCSSGVGGLRRQFLTRRCRVRGAHLPGGLFSDFTLLP